MAMTAVVMREPSISAGQGSAWMQHAASWIR